MLKITRAAAVSSAFDAEEATPFSTISIVQAFADTRPSKGTRSCIRSSVSFEFSKNLLASSAKLTRCFVMKTQTKPRARACVSELEACVSELESTRFSVGRQGGRTDVVTYSDNNSQFSKNAGKSKQNDTNHAIVAMVRSLNKICSKYVQKRQKSNISVKIL